MVASPGDRIAGYQPESVLGRGGWAVVYRAHAHDGRAVALKVLNQTHRRRAHRARLRREFDFARRLDNPHIVAIDAAGPVWLAMELLDGPPLHTLPASSDRLTALTQIADALDHAHRRGIVHCDVKPANILLAHNVSRLRAVLIDFGVAHAVVEDVGHRPGHVEASLPYSAPELLAGQAPSAATDQYALACTTIELLTGSPPFSASTATDLIDEQLYARPPRISGLPGDAVALNSIFTKALAKSPDRRHDSCTTFLNLVSEAVR